MVALIAMAEGDEMKSRKIRLSLDLTPAMKKIIEDLAEAEGATQGEILRRAIALLRAAKQAERNGRHICTVYKGKIDSRFVGF